MNSSITERLQKKLPFDELIFSFLLHNGKKLLVDQLLDQIKLFPNCPDAAPPYYTKKDVFIGLNNDTFLSKYVHITADSILNLQNSGIESFLFANREIMIVHDFDLDVNQTVIIHSAINSELTDIEWEKKIKTEEFRTLFHTYNQIGHSVITERPKYDKYSLLAFNVKPFPEVLLVHLFAYAGKSRLKMKKFIKLFSTLIFNINFNEFMLYDLIEDPIKIIDSCNLFYIDNGMVCIHPPQIWTNLETQEEAIAPYRHTIDIPYTKQSFSTIKSISTAPKENRIDKVTIFNYIANFTSKYNTEPFCYSDLYEYIVLHWIQDNGAASNTKRLHGEIENQINIYLNQNAEKVEGEYNKVDFYQLCENEDYQAAELDLEYLNDISHQCSLDIAPDLNNLGDENFKLSQSMWRMKPEVNYI